MAIYIDRLTTLSPVWRQFWHWWQNQLKKSVPVKYRRWFSHRTHILLALPTEGNMRFWRREEDTITLVGTEPVHDWQSRFQAGEDTTLTLLLLPGQYLHKQILLPLAARENLHQVIGFELDRQTPFSPDQVYFTSRVLERPSGSQQLKVELVLTPREFLDTQLDRLHRAGLKPQRVDAAALPGPYPVPFGLDLLPPRWRVFENRWQHNLNWVLAGILVLLVGVILALPVFTQNQIIKALEGQVAQVRRAAQTTAALKRQVTELERKTRFVLVRKRSVPPLVLVMEDLSQRLPQDTWLTGFNYRSGELRIDGYSPAASKLIGILENSPFLSNIHFVSPITQDPRMNLERFQISMTVGYERDDRPDG